MSAESKRRALILGVSSQDSVGGALALQLAGAGWEVAISCRPNQREALASELEPKGVARVLGLDARKPETIDAALAELARDWEQLDALIHCIVGCPSELLRAPLTAVESEDFAAVMEVGVYSLLRACRGAAPLLARSPSARVVTALSESYRLITPHYHLLGLTKAALRSAVLYLAQELGPEGVLVNAVSFSLLATAGARRTIGEDSAASTVRYLAKKAPTQQASTMADVTEALAYFAGPHCRNISGQVLTVDGGFSQLYF